MTYLYAGLGIAMLTSIMVILDVANSFLQYQSYSISYPGTYLGSTLQSKDISFLKLVSLFDSDIDCTLIEKEIQNNPLFSGLSSYSLGIPSPSSHTSFINSCVFSSQGHRVIIAPSRTFSAYPRVYSCVPDKEVVCNFELNDFDYQ